MTKPELIAALAALSAVSQPTVSNVLTALAEVTADELAYGGEVTLPGIGKLFVRDRAAGVGRNIRTGEPMQIAAKRVPKFSPAKALREALNPPAPDVSRRRPFTLLAGIAEAVGCVPRRTGRGDER